MVRKILTSSLVMAVLMVCSLSAWAATGKAGQYNYHQGLYVEGNAGIGYASVDLIFVDATISDWGGFGLNGNVGYMVNPYIGFEAGGTLYVNNASVFSMPVALKVNAPIGNRFMLFGKIGAALAFYSDPDNDNRIDRNTTAIFPYAGVGAGVAVTPQLDVTAQFAGLVGFFSNLALLTVGVTYHFDQ